MAAELLKPLPWDSQFFGFAVGRVVAPRVSASDARAAIIGARETGLRCVYALVAADDHGSSRALEDAGFHLVDVRVTFERALRPDEPGPVAGAGVTLRDAGDGDRAILRDMGARHHQQTRFYADPGFPRERCDALYATWLERSLSEIADGVILACVDGRPMGYVTWKNAGAGAEGVGEGQIGLIGVEAEARGRGLGGLLVAAAVQRSRAAGHGVLSVVTQGHNLTAQRLYQRAGFVTRQVELWYHAWPAPAE